MVIYGHPISPPFDSTFSPFPQRVATGLAAQILNMGSVSDGAQGGFSGGGFSGGGGGGGTWGTRGQGHGWGMGLVICYIAMV